MKNLSLWGYMNPKKTIAIIAVLQTLLMFFAIYIGVRLFTEDILVPTWVYYTGLTLFFVGLALYPIRRAAHPFWKMSYRRQKTMDAVLVASYMITAVAVSNNDAHLAWRTPDTAPAAVPIAIKWENTEEAKWYKKDLKKQVKQRFKAYVKAQKEKSGNNNALAFLGIFLLCLLLMTLVVFLSCSIACSGSEAGGLIVLVGGAALVIWLGISLTRRLKGKRKTKYEPMPEPEPK